MSFEPTPARRGLDLLLERHPHLELVSAGIPGRTGKLARALAGMSEPPPINAWSPSPWLMVELGQPSEGETEAYAIWPFAIWRSTGAIHSLDHNGAVSEDPILELPE